MAVPVLARFFQKAIVCAGTTRGVFVISSALATVGILAGACLNGAGQLCILDFLVAYPFLITCCSAASAASPTCALHGRCRAAFRACCECLQFLTSLRSALGAAPKAPP